jgi:hypothetical protein
MCSSLNSLLDPCWRAHQRRLSSAKRRKQRVQSRCESNPTLEDVSRISDEALYPSPPLNGPQPIEENL